MFSSNFRCHFGIRGQDPFNVETGTNAEIDEVSKSISNGYFAPLTASETVVVDGFWPVVTPGYVQG